MHTFLFMKRDAAVKVSKKILTMPIPTCEVAAHKTEKNIWNSFLINLMHKIINDKFLKSETYEHAISYKNYRKLFDSIKQKAKSQHY